MEIVQGILVVLHLVGFAAVFGSATAQLPAAQRGLARIPNGLIHGLSTMFLTGLLLVGMRYALDEPVDNAKITVKMLVLIVMIVVTLMHRRRERVSAAVLGSIAGLAVLNVALAVLWR